MRIIRIVAILLMASAVIFPQIAKASETINTDTNTKIDFSKISNFFSTATALADEKPAKQDEVATEPVAVVKEEKVKTEEEIKNEDILDKWREKQADRWSNLPKESFTINASAYTASADECGNDKGITASGIKVKEKRTIACPPELPFGVKLEIEGMGIFTCEDRGGAIKGNHIDIYVPTKVEAFQFGRQKLTAKIVEG
jgi:3D (Asp-Asp-Asp) domain-containing protein